MAEGCAFYWLKKLGLSYKKSLNNVELIEEKYQKTRELISYFLHPYSLFLNPIEKVWANIKQWIKDTIVYY